MGEIRQYSQRLTIEVDDQEVRIEISHNNDVPLFMEALLKKINEAVDERNYEG